MVCTSISIYRGNEFEFMLGGELQNINFFLNFSTNLRIDEFNGPYKFTIRKYVIFELRLLTNFASKFSLRVLLNLSSIY